ncbi:MAG TPA: hypothetical protein VLM42_14200 [Bryobacteraceae bacterium]|nr:hypothetical protein [Bryobacteraceae bacterium]
MRILNFAAAVMAISAALALAQTKVPSNGVPVHMVVTVEAPDGKDLPAPRREDLTVFEGKDRARVTEWIVPEGDRAGLELYVLVDDAVSSSVGLQLSDIRRFIENQPPTSAIGIGYLRNGTVEIRQTPTSDHAKAAAALRIPISSIVTMASPYLSLSDLIKRWPAGSQRREVLLITSGDDPLGGIGPLNPYVDAAVDDAQRAGIVVYAIYTPGIGHAGHSYWRANWGQNHLAQLAEETGAEAYVMGFGPPVSFAPYLDDLAQHLSHQYLLTFLAKPEKKASFQPITLRTEVPYVELIAPHRVYVPAGH